MSPFTVPALVYLITRRVQRRVSVMVGRVLRTVSRYLRQDADGVDVLEEDHLSVDKALEIHGGGAGGVDGLVVALEPVSAVVHPVLGEDHDQEAAVILT